MSLSLTDSEEYYILHKAVIQSGELQQYLTNYGEAANIVSGSTSLYKEVSSQNKKITKQATSKYKQLKSRYTV